VLYPKSFDCHKPVPKLHEQSSRKTVRYHVVSCLGNVVQISQAQLVFVNSILKINYLFLAIGVSIENCFENENCGENTLTSY